MGSARQRRTGNPVAHPLFMSVGVLSFSAAAIAVLWWAPAEPWQFARRRRL